MTQNLTDVHKLRL